MQGRKDVSSFVAAFTGSHRYILDYLVEEVLRRQPPDLQDFMVQTSILDRLCGSLCDAVTIRADGQATLEKLEQANLFTIHLDEERRWYRYHHLFAEFLRSRLASVKDIEAKELHRRAAEWHEQNGLAVEAVPHALVAQDWERAARLIEQTAQSFLSRGETTTLRHWLGALPAEWVAARPRLCIAQAWMLVINLETGPAESCLQQAEQSLGETDRDALMSEIISLRSFAAAFSGDLRRAAELAQCARDHSPQDNPFLRSMSALDVGIAHIMDGHAAAACEALAQATQLAEQAGHFLVAIMARCQWAEQQTYLGQLDRAAEIYEQALEFELDGRLLALLGMAYNGLGEVRRLQGRLDEAAQLLDKGLPLCQQWEEMAAMDGYVSLARTRQAQGNEPAANAMMQKAAQLARKSDLSVMDDLLVGSHKVRLWVAQGRLDEADRWVREFAPLFSGEGQAAQPYAVVELMNLALVRLWLAQGQAVQALDVIERQTQAAEQRGRTGVVIEWLALQALAHRALGDTAQALDALERALELAAPAGYVRVFVDEGTPMRSLISDFGFRIGERNPRLLAYVNKLLLAFGDKPGPANKPPTEIRNPQSKIVESLSERELDVLRLIADGLSNQEIADQLVIAVSTVKTHVNRVFGKLGVESRTQAAARARELALL